MARAGLGAAWECLFANDFDHKKSRMYRMNWNGGDELRTADVGSLTPKDIPGLADLAWASFPCQDLSLAGGGAGLKGDRSGTFRPFWNLMKGLIDEGRAPRIIVLENVCGALTSHDGKDFATICAAFQTVGYRVGALVVDASLLFPILGRDFLSSAFTRIRLSRMNSRLLVRPLPGTPEPLRELTRSFRFKPNKSGNGGSFHCRRSVRPSWPT